MTKKKKLAKVYPTPVIRASHETWKVMEKLDETVNDLFEKVYEAGYQDGLKAAKENLRR